LRINEGSKTLMAHRLSILADSTIDPLLTFLNRNASDPSGFDVTVGPYNQVPQTLLNAQNDFWSSRPDLLVIWTQPQSVLASFRALLEYQPVPWETLRDEVDRYGELVSQAASRAKFVFVLSWALPPSIRGLQTLAYKEGIGLTHTLARMNLQLAKN